MSVGVFVCPELCGCQLVINGRWVHEPDPIERINGLPVYHAFPARNLDKTSSIRQLDILQVCAKHAPWQSDPLPANPHRGAAYIDIPANPTPAEKLFIRFCSLTGGTHDLACGCKIGLCIDEPAGEYTYLLHPQHHKPCKAHAHLKGSDRHRLPVEEHYRQAPNSKIKVR